MFDPKDDSVKECIHEVVGIGGFFLAFTAVVSMIYTALGADPLLHIADSIVLACFIVVVMYTVWYPGWFRIQTQKRRFLIRSILMYGMSATFFWYVFTTATLYSMGQ